MKVNLFLNGWLHHKNKSALLSYKNVNVFTDSMDIDKCNVIYSPSGYIDITLYPSKFFIFGPHFSVFPNSTFDQLISNLNKMNNFIYIQPSEWVKNSWLKFKPECKDIIKVLPFGVDTEKFKEIKPINERELVFIYYKSRDLKELEILEMFLNKKGIRYKIFSYTQGYSEDEYLNYLQNSKYGVVLDAHESQGFALQEALSCNVPLLVWSVTNMAQELNSNYPLIPATTTPYWSSECGEFFYTYDQFEMTFNNFICNLNQYKPRKFIMENLSINKCESLLLKLIS